MKGAADLSRSLTEENYKGQYDAKYLTLKSIGKGAFGFVKLAQRRSDSEEVWFNLHRYLCPIFLVSLYTFPWLRMQRFVDKNFVVVMYEVQSLRGLWFTSCIRCPMFSSSCSYVKARGLV